MKAKKERPTLSDFGSVGRFFAGFRANLGQFWADFGRWSEGLSVSPVPWAVVGCFSCTLSEPQRATQSRFCGVAVWLYPQEQKPLRGAENEQYRGQKKSPQRAGAAQRGRWSESIRKARSGQAFRAVVYFVFFVSSASITSGKTSTHIKTILGGHLLKGI